MSRFIHRIKGPKISCTVGILSAGVGSRIKSHEPRALLKIKDKCLLEHQIEAVNSIFSSPEIITGVGYDANKIIRKLYGKSRFVENQLYDTTGSFETLRLIVNNSASEALLFLHGDLFFRPNIFDGIDLSKSFVFADDSGTMNDREVGITENRGRATIFSYGLCKKWCQIALLTGKELSMLRQICCKNSVEQKSLLTFEVLNAIINKGGIIKVHDIPQKCILEIDSMKDLGNENFNI